MLKCGADNVHYIVYQYKYRFIVDSLINHVIDSLLNVDIHLKTYCPGASYVNLFTTF